MDANLVDLDKGCYLGQEGVASQYKNPRGPPRTLYHVVFDDDNNLYEHQTRGERVGRRRPGQQRPNDTRVPVPGDVLYVLGSNEQIAVGTLTSVAEPSSTGEAAVRALALVRRADSVAQQMRTLELEFPLPPSAPSPNAEEQDVDMVLPPPLHDPLDGLEVIVKGTFTVGRLETVPIRRGRRAANVFDNVVPEFVKNLPGEDQQNDIIDVSSRVVKDTSAAAAVAMKAAAEQAEAMRKAEKMAQLQKRAAEALARRKQQKNNAN